MLRTSSQLPRTVLEKAMRLALKTASLYQSTTFPNPPVGAVALNKHGNVLAIAAHSYAGGAHAERKLIEKLRSQHLLTSCHTLVLTLEPCSHFGKTPPCVDLLIQTPIPYIVIGCLDPNPKVYGTGFLALQNAKKNVQITTLEKSCQTFLLPFAHWIQTHRPWITIKRAFHPTSTGWSMIPPRGKKTFTSPSSLKKAHQLRKSTHALLTGSGTILSDWPLFTVRHTEASFSKRPLLMVFQKTRTIPLLWIQRAEQLGFEVRIQDHSPEAALKELAKKSRYHLLLEAGPTLSNAFLTKKLWNEMFDFYKNPQEASDTLKHTYFLKDPYVYWNR